MRFDKYYQQRIIKLATGRHSKIKLFVCGFLFSFIFITTAQAKPIVDIQHWTTKNGAAVYFVKSSQLPIVDINLAFQAGSARDGKKYGLAELTNNMLGEGSSKLSANDIATAFDNVGAIFNTQTGRDMAGLSLRSLTAPKQLNPALDTFAQVLTQANFPEKALQRVKKRTLIAIKAQKQSPGVVADLAFMQALYHNQPYGHPVIGTRQSVSQITGNDVAQFYKTYYVAKNATLVIVGDISKQQAKNIANQILNGLPAGAAATKLSVSPPPSKPQVEHINFPSEQTHVRIGEVGIDWHNKNFFPLYVGNYILGGAPLTSRLFLKVREQYGLSYHIYSFFQPMETKGPFVVGLQTINAKAETAVNYTNQVLYSFIKQGPTKAELEEAKQNIIGSFPLTLDSNQKIASNVMLIGFYHLPLNYLDTYRDQIANVTQEQVKKAFADQLNLKNMTTVTVGKSPVASTNKKVTATH